MGPLGYCQYWEHLKPGSAGTSKHAQQERQNYSDASGAFGLGDTVKSFRSLGFRV